MQRAARCSETVCSNRPLTLDILFSSSLFSNSNKKGKKTYPLGPELRTGTKSR
jgi:hypothetical protein